MKWCKELPVSMIQQGFLFYLLKWHKLYIVHSILYIIYAPILLDLTGLLLPFRLFRVINHLPKIQKFLKWFFPTAFWGVLSHCLSEQRNTLHLRNALTFLPVILLGHLRAFLYVVPKGTGWSLPCCWHCASLLTKDASYLRCIRCKMLLPHCSIPIKLQ